MTLYNGASWTSCMSMPVYQLNTLLDWRVKYEEAKQQKMQEEMEKQKQQVQSKTPSGKLGKRYQ